MREKDFQKWVTDVAQRFGWRVWHVAMPMRHVGKDKMIPDKRASGLPDLIMLHADPPRLIFAELKGTGGKLSDPQKEFLGLARGIAEYVKWLQESHEWMTPGEPVVGVYSWRPGSEDIIEAILRGKTMA